jgi:hypothetical protein
MGSATTGNTNRPNPQTAQFQHPPRRPHHDQGHDFYLPTASRRRGASEPPGFRLRPNLWQPEISGNRATADGRRARHCHRDAGQAADQVRDPITTQETVQPTVSRPNGPEVPPPSSRQGPLPPLANRGQHGPTVPPSRLFPLVNLSPMLITHCERAFTSTTDSAQEAGPNSGSLPP